MRLNEDVVRGLLYNSMRLENSISQNLMKLFMTEEDQAHELRSCAQP